MDMQQQVRQWIRQRQMPAPGEHVIVGLSGGADSVALLLCLSRILPPMGATLSAVHVHHGIRGEEADRDAEFCRSLCEALDIPFRAEYCDVPTLAKERHISTEEAARRERYRILEEAADRCGAEGTGVRIALAHHLDDQAETMLLNLCRGTGIRGAGAMAPVQGRRIRPLLECRRRDIVRWLTEQGQSWIEDSSNGSDEYTRNRIRHHILPALEEDVNARTAEHLAAFAARARELDDYLEREAERWLREHVPELFGRRFRELLAGSREEPHRLLDLPVTAAASLPEALRGRILHRILSETAGGSRDLTARHVEMLEDLLLGETGREADLPGGIRVRRSYERLEFRTAAKPTQRQDRDLACEGSGCASVSEPDDAVLTEGESCDGRGSLSGWHLQWRIMERKPGENFPQNRYTKWFDYDKIRGILRLRPRREGDQLTLSGVGTKSVRRYMIDARIPAEERGRIPILADDSRVLWIIGYRMNAEYQVTESTKTILEVTADRDR